MFEILCEKKIKGSHFLPRVAENIFNNYVIDIIRCLDVTSKQ